MKFYRALPPIRILFFILLYVLIVNAQQNNEIKYAENLLRSRSYEPALLIFQKQFNNGNTSASVVNGLSRCLEELHMVEEWIVFLKEVIVKLPASFNYQVHLGKAYYMNDQKELAQETWEKVYIHSPPEIMRFRLVGQSMIQLRLFDEAIEVYENALEKMNNQDALNLEIAKLYRAQFDYEKATEHYLKYYLKFKKQHGYVRTMLINMAKDDEATERIIKKVQAFDNDEDPDLQEILSNLYMRKKDYAHALEIILSIENRSAKKQFTYLNRFAVEAEKDKAFEYVILAYENIINFNNSTTSSDAELKLAKAYFRSGIDLLDEDKKEQSEALIKKAHLLLEKMMTDNLAKKYQAAELSGDIYKIYYNDLDQGLLKYKLISLNRVGPVNADQVRVKMADIYILKNNLENAVKEYKSVKSKNYKAFSKYNLAEINYFNAQFSKAKKGYQDLISKVGMKDSLANNAMDRSFEIELFTSDSVNYAKFVSASLLERQNKFSEAAKIFEEVYNSQNIVSFASGLKAVKLYNRLNKEIEANILLEGLIENYPEEEQIDYIYFLLANNYKKAHDYGSALSLYQEILIMFPTSFYVDEARSYAREINSLLKENPN